MPLNSEGLKDAARVWGAQETRVADLKRLRGIQTIPADLLQGFCRGVSVAVRLSDAVIDAIDDRPTPLYQQHYQIINDLLDQICLKLALLLQEHGAAALPIPASQLLDCENYASYISHKAVAVAAGMGWQGKSLLTVHPKFGPRIRLATVLTNANLDPDKPLKNRCGGCDACAAACPAKAIKNANTDSHYASRDEALYFERCLHHLLHTCKKLPHITSSICGVCIKVCPWGKVTKSP